MPTSQCCWGDGGECVNRSSYILDLEAGFSPNTIVRHYECGFLEFPDVPVFLIPSNPIVLSASVAVVGAVLFLVTPYSHQFQNNPQTYGFIKIEVKASRSLYNETFLYSGFTNHGLLDYHKITNILKNI